MLRKGKGKQNSAFRVYDTYCTTKYTYIFGKRKDENSKRERLHWIVCSEEEYNDCCSLIVRTACGQITGKK